MTNVKLWGDSAAFWRERAAVVDLNRRKKLLLKTAPRTKLPVSVA